MTATKRPTNREFATTDTTFIKACERVGIKPTARQASKWHRRIGLAFTKGRAR
jgi:hypothetical protein